MSYVYVYTTANWSHGGIMGSMPSRRRRTHRRAVARHRAPPSPRRRHTSRISRILTNMARTILPDSENHLEKSECAFTSIRCPCSTARGAAPHAVACTAAAAWHRRRRRSKDSRARTAPTRAVHAGGSHLRVQVRHADRELLRQALAQRGLAGAGRPLAAKKRARSHTGGRWRPRVVGGGSGAHGAGRRGSTR